MSYFILGVALRIITCQAPFTHGSLWRGGNLNSFSSARGKQSIRLSTGCKTGRLPRPTTENRKVKRLSGNFLFSYPLRTRCLRVRLFLCGGYDPDECGGSDLEPVEVVIQRDQIFKQLQRPLAQLGTEQLLAGGFLPGAGDVALPGKIRLQ